MRPDAPALFEIANRFRVEGLLAQGGMCRVFRARDRETGELLAIKLFGGVAEPERFEREAEVLATVRHPNVVRYVGHGVTERGDPWLATELLDGEDLLERLDRGPLSLRETLPLGTALAATLGHAHAHGLVHRDIKPANIFLRNGRIDRPCLLDFGLVRAVGVRSLTRTGVTMGTFEYIAPEQFRDAKRVDARADVFSLGCVLFHALTGRSPFYGMSPNPLHALLYRRAPAVGLFRDDVPQELSDLLERMLAKSPSQRPESREVLAELASYASRVERGHDVWDDESITMTYATLDDDEVELDEDDLGADDLGSEAVPTLVMHQPWWESATPLG